MTLWRMPESRLRRSVRNSARASWSLWHPKPRIKEPSFRPLKLKALMDSLTPEEEATLTDGCKIYLLKGEPVAIVPGDVTNLKITYPSDLAFAEAFAAEEDR